MRRVSILVALLLVASPWLPAPPVAAEDVRGQVVAIDVTRCAADTCVGDVVLVDGAGRTVVRVTPATTILRDGRPVALVEVGVGNAVHVVDGEAVAASPRMGVESFSRAGAPPPFGIQAP